MIAKDEWKRAAAEAASVLVTDGMVVGLGTGSTAAHLVRILGERVRAGLRIVALPTSEATARLATEQGIALGAFADHLRIDLTIDGADEIAEGTLDLIKGGGGALLREKIVASASDRMVVIADSTKLVASLGKFPLPVEIASFGWEVTLTTLAKRARTATLRMDAAGAPFVTDGGHYIVDCDMGQIKSPAALERDLNGIVGVMETGLFVGMAREVFLAGDAGVRCLSPG
jgi:ribose 5-phosphate isomerase A